MDNANTEKGNLMGSDAYIKNCRHMSAERGKTSLT